MLKLTLALIPFLVACRLHGQGQVVFANLGGGVNAPVTDICAAGRGLGPAWSAQLWFLGTSGALTPLVPISTFRPAGTGAEAIADRYWASQTVEVPGIPSGSAATFVVRVWPTAAGSFDAAKATGIGYGESAPFTVTVGGGLVPPANLTTLQGFSVGPLACPEPSTVAIGLVGAAAVAICGRQKRKMRD